MKDWNDGRLGDRDDGFSRKEQIETPFVFILSNIPLFQQSTLPKKFFFKVRIHMRHVITFLVGNALGVLTREDDQILEQVIKQLNKLISVIKVVDLIEKDFIEREMVLVKVSATSEAREEILRVADIFRGK